MPARLELMLFQTMDKQIPPWLTDEFDRLNKEHFGGGLPHVSFACGRFAGYFAIYMPGARMIQFDPRTLEQSREWISDTLLHEMVHHSLAEESRGAELIGDTGNDHGRRFCRVANRIGVALGLTRVAAGRTAAIEWPQSVRPAGYSEWEGSE